MVLVDPVARTQVLRRLLHQCYLSLCAFCQILVMSTLCQRFGSDHGKGDGETSCSDTERRPDAGDVQISATKSQFQTCVQVDDGGAATAQLLFSLLVANSVV